MKILCDNGVFYIRRHWWSTPRALRGPIDPQLESFLIQIAEGRWINPGKALNFCLRLMVAP